MKCTCPPEVDVMRGRATETRYPCPMHPEPDLRGIVLLPRIIGPINLRPIRHR